MRIWHGGLIVLILLVAAENLRACFACRGGNVGQLRSYREDVRSVKIVLIGSLSNPRLQGNQGFTDIDIEHVVQTDGSIAGMKRLTLPRYVPIDPKNPPHYLFFGDMRNGTFDLQRGIPLKGTGMLEYLNGALKIDDKDRVKVLQYHFNYLDSQDPEVAMDAFVEFAKASDQEVNQVAKQVAPDKLRKMLRDPLTPADKVGLFAYLLGACGNKDDLALFTAMIAKKDDRTAAALSGLLGGMLELNPDEGWKQIERILVDPKCGYGEKLSAIGTVKFCQICKPKDRNHILRAYTTVIQDGDIADMAIEDLRRWGWWDLTGTILAQYGKKTYSAPLMKRCMVRYALCCPEKEAEAFIQSRRLLEPDLVKSVEESLQYERASTLPVKNRQ
jgi:hypothetical protein